MMNWRDGNPYRNYRYRVRNGLPLEGPLKTGPVPRSLTDRFWEKVEKGDGCWLWKGQIGTPGYGTLSVSHNRKRSAHRVSWELHYGTVPDGMCVLHRCDNRPCVRPDHLFVGTLLDNNVDCIKKGRWRGFDYGDNGRKAALIGNAKRTR
jgi:hypothetical protein